MSRVIDWMLHCISERSLLSIDSRGREGASERGSEGAREGGGRDGTECLVSTWSHFGHARFPSLSSRVGNELSCCWWCRVYVTLASLGGGAYCFIVNTGSRPMRGGCHLLKLAHTEWCVCLWWQIGVMSDMHKVLAKWAMHFVSLWLSSCGPKQESVWAWNDGEGPWQTQQSK